jgi:hypothetical protein
MITKPLEQSTYKRDGEWYTMHVIDRGNAIERPATEDEIATVDEKTEKIVHKSPEKKGKAKK